ncbi:creatininase [Mycobacterium sp. ST-F2]|nr:creatininase [Mycobacterium sp. ST-F2]
MVPLGATEQHGPHLPLDTDTRIAEAVSRSVAEELRAQTIHGGDQPAWLVAAAISYGASGEHESFPGTISIGLAALELLLVEFGRSVCNWAGRVVFVNGHGGNVAALRAATELLRAEGRDVAWCACTAAGADAHAGHTETSVLLHLSPADVWVDESVVGNTAPLPELLPALRRGGVAAVSPVGVLGDATTATASEGARIFAEMVGGCVRRIGTWRPGPGGMLA